jgi:hypothetical protein
MKIANPHRVAAVGVVAKDVGVGVVVAILETTG